MESVYRFREKDRKFAKVAIVIAIANLILVGMGIVVFVLSANDGKSGLVLPYWGMLVSALWMALCVGILINSRHRIRFSAAVSDTSLRIGNATIMWDQIEEVVHHPSSVIAWEFCVNTRDGKRLNVYSGLENVQQLEDTIRARL